jgi:phospholipid/cholesterol/gamma-HCH transport system substrate-binding protein
MRSVSVAGRVAAIGAVVVAIVVVAMLLFGGGGGYHVKAYFQNAGQLVSGDQVEVGGTPAGSVDGFSLTDNGQAEVKLTVDDKYKPLPLGTQAVIRQASQSGIANRYVELDLPPSPKSARKVGTIPNGGSIPITKTTTAVDLDQLFNTLDPPTRQAIKAFFKNSAAQYVGKTDQQRLAFHYLNPALSTSSRLFGELNRDSPLLSRFLTDSARLVDAIAAKRNDLAAFVSNANATFRALGNQRLALAQAIAALPGFMRQANTTFVNLRATLNDVDPLVNASKPVAIALRPFLAQLRPLAHDAVPTVNDLADVVLKPGRNNDLFDLMQSFPPLASAALDTKHRKINFGTGPVGVGKVQGAFPETARALEKTSPIIAQGRPYTPDLIGWFDDFSTSGGSDAAGGVSRALSVFNLFDLTGNIPTCPAVPAPDQVCTINTGVPGLPQPINGGARLAAFNKTARVGQFKKCPGGAEQAAVDGSNVWSAADQHALDCKESAREVGGIP